MAPNETVMWKSFRLNVKIVNGSDKMVHFGRFVLHFGRFLFHFGEQLEHFMWKTLIQKTTSPAHLREAPLSLKAGEAGADGLLHWGDGQIDLARSSFATGFLHIG